MGTAITYVDLFSGAGGFASGLLQAGFTFKTHYFSEIDRDAIAVYRYHFPKSKPLGSIEKVSQKTIREKVDLLTFGFPCQDLSVAGQRKGLKGKRSKLFFEAMRLIRYWKPRVFIFENVKGLFSAEQGRAFETILREVANIGIYECQWQLCNTAWFLPQNRERIYFVASLGTKTAPKVFPLSQSRQLPEKSLQKRQENKDHSSTITSSYSKGEHARGETYVDMLYWKNSKEKWVKEPKHKVPTLKTQSDLSRQTLLASGWIPLKRIRSINRLKGIDYTPFSEKDYCLRPNGLMGTITSLSCDRENLLAGYVQYDPTGKGHKSQHARIYTIDGHAPTLTNGVDFKIFDKRLIRRLTPIECERLQGFPDQWTKYGYEDGSGIEISDTQRYRMMGNAVSVPVVIAVTRPLISHFRN